MTTFAHSLRSKGRADSARSILPRTGIVLISSALAAPALAAMIAALDGPPPVIAGWIDLSDSPNTSSADSPLPRLGNLKDLPSLVARLSLKCAVVCATANEAERIRLAAAGTGLELRIVPPIDELLAPPVANPERQRTGGPFPTPAFPPHDGGSPDSRYTHPTSIDLGALIGRTPHTLDRDAVAKILTGKRILITGAGDSIGSELARVAASFNPEQLILMERAENALFEIDRQMRERHPGMGRRAVLHDVTDAEGTRRLLAELRPHVVFHSAAHKHVPLMEDHPGHAVTNNLFGTKSIADAAVAAGAERFVMISSDKAVNPTSVMGATKRLAELYVRGLGARAGVTKLSMVRFGNVLGSACSVLTIWSSQLAEGGPITITDARMTRYFMTIPEAATLVVQSMVVESASSRFRPEGPSAAGDEKPRPRTAEIGRDADSTRVGVFVLDMGQPIPITDLAARFVRAHGLWPRAEHLPTPPPNAPTIDLIFTGTRPGEKLHEELAYAAEALRPTTHPGVRSWAGPGFGQADIARVHEMVAELGAARFDHDPAAILAAIRRHVPEFRSSK